MDISESQLNQIRSILNLDGWNVIQEMLKEELPDVYDGGYETIAINVLAKCKAKEHINFILNKINGLKEMPKKQSESFK